MVFWILDSGFWAWSWSCVLRLDVRGDLGYGREYRAWTGDYGISCMQTVDEMNDSSLFLYHLLFYFTIPRPGRSRMAWLDGAGLVIETPSPPFYIPDDK